MEPIEVQAQEEMQEEMQEEQQAQTALEASPAAEPQAEEPQAEEPQAVAALQQELQELKEERRRQLLLEETRTLLEERQIPGVFAEYLLGADLEVTRQNAAEFCRQYAQALRQAMAARLPRSQPRDFDAARPRPSRRGVFRI